MRYLKMRKLVLGLAMVVTMLAMVGCGTSKEEGFAPEQVVENEVVTDNVKENIEEIAEDDLTQYYDVEQYVGTPRIETFTCLRSNENGTAFRNDNYDYIRIAYTDKVEVRESYDCVLVDNNTPDNIHDDVIVYVFTE